MKPPHLYTQACIILGLILNGLTLSTAYADHPGGPNTLKGEQSSSNTPINFVVSLPAPPSRIYKVWHPFAQYLQSRTGRQVNLLTPKGLDKIDDMLDQGSIDLIYINSYAYYLHKQHKQLTAIAQMRNKAGGVTSRGRVMVRKDSGITHVNDLKGGSISLISPNGAGSYLAPRAFFLEQGIELTKDITVNYSGDLKKSVYDVLLKETSAAVMCGVNYDIITKKIDMKDIFVMELTDEFPEAVIAVKADMDESLKQLLISTITEMSTTYGGRQALIKLRNTKIHDFIVYDAAVENQTQQLMVKAKL